MKRALYREGHIGKGLWLSALALFFGWLMFFGGCAQIGQRIAEQIDLESGTVTPSRNTQAHSESSLNPLLGLQIILGTSAYRSIKKRKLGIRSESELRTALEILCLIIVWFPNFFLVLGGGITSPKFLEKLAYDSAELLLTHIVVPLWSFIAYAIIKKGITKKGDSQ